ncbi:MAG: DUF58 domain-containing protein [Candidatus Gracilibacteria bacterium]|nr:DUF58 domain-containing protein [Candidatus Gracilibacteria bacterium]
MLTKKHKAILELKINRSVDTQLIGNYKTNFKNKGIEFADFREYISGDDAKDIDWGASSKTDKTLVKLYDEERELDVHFLPFFGEDIDTEFGKIKKREIFEEVLYILGVSTLKEQNKFAGLHYNNGKKQLFPLGKSNAHFHDYFSKIEKNIFKNDNISEQLGYFNNLSVKNSLVILFTSSLEIDSKILKIAALKNDIIVCHIFHSFENSLDGSGIFGLKNGDTKIFIDLDDHDKKEHYRKIRKEKIINFRSQVRKSGAGYLYLDEKSHIFGDLYTFFKNR